MKSEDFDKCRQFLESQLLKNIDNKDLLGVYQRLIELKSQYDLATDKAVIEKEIKEAELNNQFRTAVYGHDTDFNKTWHAQQAETQRHAYSTQGQVFNNAMNNGFRPWNPQNGALPPNQGV